MPQDADLNYCRESLLRSDYHHYLVSLFMPPSVRPGLWVLGAFKLTLETIPASVTEPTLGYMRLAWWRDQAALLRQGDFAKGQPVLAGLAEYCHPCDSRDIIAFIDEHETLIDNPGAEMISTLYPQLLEKILGAHLARYRKLETKLTVILKKYHGTRWEHNPPFLALRLWWASLFC